LNLDSQINRLFMLVLLSIALSDLANAARAGIVITSSNNTITRCINIQEGESVYDSINRMNITVLWSEKGIYGRALCKINDTGDEISGTSCKWSSNYWGFYIRKESEWVYSPVGFEGNSCFNQETSIGDHYCISDYEVIGLAYGDTKIRPRDYSFEEICNNPAVQEMNKTLPDMAKNTKKMSQNSSIPVILTAVVITAIIIYFAVKKRRDI
jgi:hypothetical protein